MSSVRGSPSRVRNGLGQEKSLGITSSVQDRHDRQSPFAGLRFATQQHVTVSGKNNPNARNRPRGQIRKSAEVGFLPQNSATSAVFRRRMPKSPSCQPLKLLTNSSRQRGSIDRRHDISTKRKRGTTERHASRKRTAYRFVVPLIGRRTR